MSRFASLVNARPGYWLWLILLFGLLIRLPWLTKDSHITADVPLQLAWIKAIQQEGLTRYHLVSATRTYPMTASYLYGSIAWLAKWLPAGDQPLIVLLKLPALLADLLTALLIYWAWRHRPAGQRLFSVAAYLFNPAIWYVSSYWGQTEALYTFFLALAIVELQKQQDGPAGIAFVLAIGSKLQSLALAPLLLIVGWPKWRLWLSSMATAALLLLPWLITGQLNSYANTFGFRPGQVVSSAYNFWYLLLRGQILGVSSSQQPAGLPFSYTQLGEGLFLLTAIMVIGLNRQRLLSFPAGVLTLALFLFMPDVHERYLFPTLLFLLLATADNGQLWWAYGLISLTFLFNLVTIASFAPAYWINLVTIQPPYTPLIALLKAGALLTALLNVGLLLWLMKRGFADGR